MRNIFAFYCLIATPLLALVILASTHRISATLFAVLMIIYAFIYHPLLCGLRLVETGKISNDKVWRSFIPFWNWKYTTFLFFNR